MDWVPCPALYYHFGADKKGNLAHWQYGRRRLMSVKVSTNGNRYVCHLEGL